MYCQPSGSEGYSIPEGGGIGYPSGAYMHSGGGGGQGQSQQPPPAYGRPSPSMWNGNNNSNNPGQGQGQARGGGASPIDDRDDGRGPRMPENVRSTSQSQSAAAAAAKTRKQEAEDKDKGRGSYRCGKCGVPKKGHICPYQPKLKRRPDEPPPETRNAATQVEMDEFLVVRRLNLEIQGFPESYTEAPMGEVDVGVEVHPVHPALEQGSPQQQQGVPLQGQGPPQLGIPSLNDSAMPLGSSALHASSENVNVNANANANSASSTMVNTGTDPMAKEEDTGEYPSY